MLYQSASRIFRNQKLHLQIEQFLLQERVEWRYETHCAWSQVHLHACVHVCAKIDRKCVED